MVPESTLIHVIHTIHCIPLSHTVFRFISSSHSGARDVQSPEPPVHYEGSRDGAEHLTLRCYSASQGP